MCNSRVEELRILFSKERQRNTPSHLQTVTIHAHASRASAVTDTPTGDCPIACCPKSLRDLGLLLVKANLSSLRTRRFYDGSCHFVRLLKKTGPLLHPESASDQDSGNEVKPILMPSLT